MYGIVSPDPKIYPNEQSINPVYYGAAKAALIQLTKLLACRYAHQGIRFNSISPGPFPNPTVQANDAKFIEKLCEKVPMQRIGQPQETCRRCIVLSVPGFFICHRH